MLYGVPYGFPLSRLAQDPLASGSRLAFGWGGGHSPPFTHGTLLPDPPPSCWGDPHTNQILDLASVLLLGL